MRYRREFWRVMERGLYVHPGHQSVIRCYGYVKNVVYQIRKIFDTDVDLVRGQTFYLGDRPINLFDWVNSFSKALTGREVRVVPRLLMRALALLGDVPTYLTGKPFLQRQKFCVEDPRLLTAEGADLLAFHVHRVDGRNNPHFLYHAAEDKFMSYWSRCGRDLQQLRTFLQAYGFLHSKVL